MTVCVGLDHGNLAELIGDRHRHIGQQNFIGVFDAVAVVIAPDQTRQHAPRLVTVKACIGRLVRHHRHGTGVSPRRLGGDAVRQRGRVYLDRRRPLEHVRNRHVAVRIGDARADLSTRIGDGDRHTREVRLARVLHAVTVGVLEDVFLDAALLSEAIIARRVRAVHDRNRRRIRATRARVTLRGDEQIVNRYDRAASRHAGRDVTAIAVGQHRDWRERHAGFSAGSRDRHRNIGDTGFAGIAQAVAVQVHINRAVDAAGGSEAVVFFFLVLARRDRDRSRVCARALVAVIGWQARGEDVDAVRTRWHAGRSERAGVKDAARVGDDRERCATAHWGDDDADVRDRRFARVLHAVTVLVPEDRAVHVAAWRDGHARAVIFCIA